MATDKKGSKAFWILIAIIMFVMLCIAVAAYLFGKHREKEKYTQERLHIDVRIDSLRDESLRLQYSLDSLKNERNKLAAVRTVFKTVYDTVYIKTVPAKVVDGLNSVINTPIPVQQ